MTASSPSKESNAIASWEEQNHFIRNEMLSLDAAKDFDPEKEMEELKTIRKKLWQEKYADNSE